MQHNIILGNCRKYLTFVCCQLLINDIVFLYPAFLKQELVNKIAIIIMTVFSAPVHILVVHSFWRRSFRFIKHMLILMCLRMLASFSHMPNDTVGTNYFNRCAMKLIAASLILMQLVQLIGQVVKSHRVTFWFAVFNIVGIFA